MFFNVFNRAILCAGIFALTACGGGEPIDAAGNTVHPVTNSAVQHAVPPAAAAPAGASGAAQGGGALRIPPAVSMADREAEQLRMVPYEQAFALEMQRRAQERPEHLREQGESVPAPAQAACDSAPDPGRPAGCAATQPGAATAPPAQAL